jgi:serine/threonine protein kinase
MLKTRKIKPKTKNTFRTRKQKGGKKLGQGSYGCVISPPVKCLNNSTLRKNFFEYNDNYISKIIRTKYSDVAFSELNVGTIVHSIDKHHNFFIPYINACYFSPQKHADIVYLDKNGVDLSPNPEKSKKINKYNTMNTQSEIASDIMKNNKNKCVLKNNDEYLNLIGPIAGDNLGSIFLTSKTSDKITFIKNNYWYIFSYLVHGLALLHKKDIIHKDIKPSNIVIDFNYFSSMSYYNLPIMTCRIRYIDFGLSLVLNRRKYSSSEIIELLMNGTHYYTPLDIIALKIIYKLLKRGHNIDDKDFLYQMMIKSGKLYQKNRDYYHYEGIRTNYFKYGSDTESLSDKSFFLTPAKYEQVFKTVLDIFKTNKMESKIHDFLYGWDIFSLGVVLAKICIKCDIHDNDFKKLIFKMIEPNPLKRININELTKTYNYVKNINSLSYLSKTKLA